LAETAEIEQHVRRWLEQVVVGLNLCPFAARPLRENQLRITVSEARDEESLLSDLHAELALLDEKPTQELQTTLLIAPHMLADFDTYNDLLDLVDALLDQFEWTGIYQVASFHPGYRFADTAAEDSSNLTNRAPYPILHLLREESLDQALESFPDPESIPERNIQRMESLSDDEKRRLFPYLFDGPAAPPSTLQ